MVAPASVTALLQFGAALNNALGGGLVWSPGDSARSDEACVLLEHAQENVVAVDLGASSGHERVSLCLNLAPDVEPNAKSSSTHWIKLGVMELSPDTQGEAVGTLVNQLRLLRRLTVDLHSMHPQGVDLTPTELTVERTAPYRYKHYLVLGRAIPITTYIVEGDNMLGMASKFDTVHYPLADLDDDAFRAELPRMLDQLLRLKG